MANRLRYGAVAVHDDDLALLVFTPKGQARYVTLTAEQALTCIESLASVLRQQGGPDDRP
jgi:hypothetical protein